MYNTKVPHIIVIILFIHYSFLIPQAMFNDSKGRAGLKFAYAFANMPTAEFSLSPFLFLNACQKPMDDVRYINSSIAFLSFFWFQHIYSFYLTFNEILQLIITCNLDGIIFSK